MRTSSRRALASFLVLAAAAAALPASAQPLSNTLTAEQVACNESQLQQLLQRMTLNRGTGANRSRALTLFVTYSNPYGFYEGLAVMNQAPLRASGPLSAAEAEQLLAFHINPSIRTLLINPARPMLAQISLEREDAGSNLVGAGGATAISLSLNPTLGTGATGSLRINNFTATNAQACGGVSSVDVKPGRGLISAGLLTPCHTLFSDFDRTVFAILERTLRVQSASGVVDAKIALYRGEQPFTYRIDVYPLSSSGQMSGKIALLLTLNVDGAGQISTGQLSVLPTCVGIERSGCSNSETSFQIFLLPPVFAGVEGRTASGPSFSLAYQFGTTPAPVTIDWNSLLSGTSWNGGTAQ